MPSAAGRTGRRLNEPTNPVSNETAGSQSPPTTAPAGRERSQAGGSVSAGAMSHVEFRVLATREQFARVHSDWDELVLAMPRPSPFFLHRWLDAWWQYH